MSISLKISPTEASELKAYYISKRSEIAEQLSSVDSILKQLSGTDSTATPKTETIYHIDTHRKIEGYSSKMTWIETTKFFITYLGGTATTTEIVNAILTAEPKYKNDRKKVVGSISAILSTHSKDGGVFGKEKNAEGENVYCIM